MSQEVVNDKEFAPMLISEPVIKDKIYFIRGQQVMLDFELAEIYGYTTTRFNEQVKNNIEKFDDDFMFELTKQEFENLISKKSTSSWGGRRKLPKAFSKKGVYMLMTVLKGELATQQSKRLIRLFETMENYIVENSQFVTHEEFGKLTLQTLGINQKLDKIIVEQEKLSDLSERVERLEKEYVNPVSAKSFVIMNGKKVEASILHTTIIKQAVKSIIYVDRYISLKTLEWMTHANPGVDITIVTQALATHKDKVTNTEYTDFLTENPGITLRLLDMGKDVHDRLLILDYGELDWKLYNLGGSQKDSGMHITTINESANKDVYNDLISNKLLIYPPFVY